MQSLLPIIGVYESYSVQFPMSWGPGSGSLISRHQASLQYPEPPR